MKINILVSLKEGPWGGGNQFLKALKSKLIDAHCYEEDPSKAHVILFNSYNAPLFRDLYLLKKTGKTVIHRVDGPIWYTRGEGREMDNIIFNFNKNFADGTIFQSLWSQKKCYEAGFRSKSFETVILNAPSDRIFFPTPLSPKDTKIKLITTSWSSNSKKGFDIYQFLDENLDFTQYEYTFIGNSPTRFKNIRCIPPLSSEEIAIQLRNHDLFITASQGDPCSNALLEALHCGLPAVARHSGGHPEIIGKGGELFRDRDDILVTIKKVASGLDRYRHAIDLPSIHEIVQKYYHFCQKVFLECGKNPKKFLYFSYLNLMKKAYCWKLTNILSLKISQWNFPSKRNSLH